MSAFDNLTIDEWLEKQRLLQVEAFGQDPTTLDADERARSFRENVVALTFELAEAGQEIGWKPWATSRHMNHTPYLKECVDALHFMGNIVLLGRPREGEISQLYLAKRDVNLQRQIEGYDGVAGKCGECGREQ